jgi:hypothetical protein
LVVADQGGESIAALHGIEWVILGAFRASGACR